MRFLKKKKDRHTVDVSEITLESFIDSRRYQLDMEIARGGMGTVYRANQLGAEGFSKTVALKMVLPEFSSNDQFVTLFIGEAKLVADLVHENIVQVYHLGERPDQFYIAMEFVDGINLKEFLSRHEELGQSVDPDIGAFIISRLCRALHYAHEKKGRDKRPLNIVHRDVTPRNIMINFEGVVKLTDFGIAKASQVMKQPPEKSVLMGKIPYMSPEQASMKTTDRRSDLFSLGVVMYEMLTGRYLFAARDRSSTLESVRSAPIPDPLMMRPDLPPELGPILLKLLERDIAKRYQTAGEAGYDLEYYMYHDRYGPTNEKLADYLRSISLGSGEPPPSGRGEPPPEMGRTARAMQTTQPIQTPPKKSS